MPRKSKSAPAETAQSDAVEEALAKVPATPAENAEAGAEAAPAGGINDKIRNLIRLSKEQGYLTFDDINDRGQRQQLAGNTFRLTSRRTYALGATFSHSLGSLGRFQLTPSYQYKSKHFFDDNNANFGGILSQDGFGLCNVRAAFLPQGSRWEVVAYVDNLFGKDYIIDAGNTGGAFGIPTFIAGDPRLFGVRATFRF